MKPEVKHILDYSSAISVLLPSLLCLRYPRVVITYSKHLFALVILCIIVEAIGTTLSIFRLNNIWLFYLFTMIEFYLLVESIQEFSIKRLPIFTVIGLVLLNGIFVCIDFFFITELNDLNFFSRSVESLLLIGVSLYGFYDLMKNSSTLFIQKSPLFWLLFGILFYSAGNLFLFATRKLLFEKANLPVHNFWVIHSIINIIFNLLLAKTLLCLRTESKYPSSLLREL